MILIPNSPLPVPLKNPLTNSLCYLLHSLLLLIQKINASPIKYFTVHATSALPQLMSDFTEVYWKFQRNPKFGYVDPRNISTSYGQLNGSIYKLWWLSTLRRWLSLPAVVMNDFCLNFRLVKGRVIKLLSLNTVSSNKLSRENGDLSLFYGKFILWPWPGKNMGVTEEDLEFMRKR